MKSVQMKSKLKSALIVCSALLIILYNNCGSQAILVSGAKETMGVTSVGNPYRETKAHGFRSELCQKLVSCHQDLSIENCEIGIGSTAGLNESLGIPNNRLATFTDLILAEFNKLAVANVTQLQSCTNDIKTLDCQSGAMKNSYSPTAALPFGGVPQMISSLGATCTNSFGCIGDCVSAGPSPTNGAAPTITPTPTPTLSPSPTPTTPACAPSGTGSISARYCVPAGTSNGADAGANSGCCSGQMVYNACVSNDYYCIGSNPSLPDLCDFACK